MWKFGCSNFGSFETFDSVHTYSNFSKCKNVMNVWKILLVTFSFWIKFTVPNKNWNQGQQLPIYFGWIGCLEIPTKLHYFHFGLPKWNWILNFNKQSRCLMDFGTACDSFITFVLYYVINAMSISKIHAKISVDSIYLYNIIHCNM